MFCSNCGTKIPDNVKFCPKCGSKNILKNKDIDSEKKDSQEREDISAGLSKNKRNAIIGVISVICAVVIVILLVVIPKINKSDTVVSQDSKDNQESLTATETEKNQSKGQSYTAFPFRALNYVELGAYKGLTVPYYSITENDTVSEQEEAARNAKKELLSMVVEDAVINGYPEELYTFCKKYETDTLQSFADMYGVSLEEFLDSYMPDVDLETETQKMVNEILVCQAIVETENIDILGNDYEDKAKNIAVEYGYENVDDFSSVYGVDGITYLLVWNSAMDYLYDNAYVVKAEQQLEPESVEYIFQDSSERFLTADDLEGLSSEELSLAKNEIYARHGLKFKDSTLADYFSSKEWYSPCISEKNFVKCLLNIYEQTNVDMLTAAENGTSYSNENGFEDIEKEIEDSFSGTVDLSDFNKFLGKWDCYEGETITITDETYAGHPYHLIKFKYNDFNRVYEIALVLYYEGTTKILEIVTEQDDFKLGFDVTYFGEYGGELDEDDYGVMSEHYWLHVDD